MFRMHQQNKNVVLHCILYALLFRKFELTSGYRSNHNDSVIIQSFFYRVWSGPLLRSTNLLMRFTTRSSVAMSKQPISTVKEYMDAFELMNVLLLLLLHLL